MPIFSIIRMGFMSLWGNRLRSVLSMLGIIIGVGSVIASLSLGESLRQHTLNQIRKMGTNLLIVIPTQKKVRGIRSVQADSLTLQDAQAILELDKVQRVSPVVGFGLQIKAGGRNRNAVVQGVAPTYQLIHGIEVAEGRFFMSPDVLSLERVALLGSRVAKDLFPLESALGKEFRIRNTVFFVIGVLKERGEEGMSPDDQILVPYTTMMKKLMGRTSLHRVDASAISEGDVLTAEEQISALLKMRHRIRADEDPDFRIVNMSRIMETFNMLGFWFTVFLGGMAGISLLVGGIGIMNIMLVTVTERTAEIGVRKAIGAKNRDILRQFLLEAVVMTFSGGVIGTVLAMSLLYSIGYYFSVAVVIPPVAFVIGIGFSGFVGIFFGYYPALSASRLNPIDCLRYE
jgi:putative ABC transport system permease protein